MATKENTGSQNPSVFRRQLLDLQFQTYRRIVERKHGIVPLTFEETLGLTDEELSSYVDALKDMAHLPPS